MTVEQLRKEIEEVKKEMLLAAIFGEKDKVKLCKKVIAQNEKIIGILESRNK
jgi:hypothetical protein